MHKKPKTIYQMVEMMKSVYANNIAVCFCRQEIVYSISYLEFYEDICRGVSFFRQLCGKECHHIAILANNSYSYLVNILAIILSGNVVVPLNIQKNIEEISYELQHADIDFVLHDGLYIEREPDLREQYNVKLFDMDCYKNVDPDYSLEDCSEEDLAMIIFTSGTTAKSRGVMISQKNIFSACNEASSLEIEFNRELDFINRLMTSFLILPFFHVASLINFFSYIEMGSTIHLCTDIRQFIDTYKIIPGEHILVTPTILEFIYKHFVRGSHLFDKLRLIETCGAKADDSIMIYLRNKGLMVNCCYGLTETFANGTRNSSQEEKNSMSIGKVINNLEGTVMDGEFCLRGDSIMMGYYKDPEATAQAIDSSGWFHTGDLARIDEEGYVYLIGRKKNVIILSSGENINPEELENIILKNENVLEVVVKENENKIGAVIYCKSNEREIEEYIAQVNRTLPRYKQIAFVEFQNHVFEKTALGKIKRI